MSLAQIGRSGSLIGAIAIAGLLSAARPAAGYSVIAHLEAIDVLWDREIAGLLAQRFGPLDQDRLREARAYAYGGALIQDLGYYPFGSHLFTNLTHYVRSGDFVQALLRDAGDPDEYAFAIGALAHYAFDNAGHPIAVNRAVPMMYPKVREKVGSRALYVDSPPRHLMVEFAFDVLQVARGDYQAQAYRDRIGFKVATPLLERAFRETYGVELKDLFLDEDLAIGTYRHAVGSTIPDLTRVAWEQKQKEILQRTPKATQKSFVFLLPPREYEHEFGSTYRKPSLLARIIGVLEKILPKVGPLKPLAFEPLSPDAEALFEQSVAAARERYRAGLDSLKHRRLSLPNTDFDTGRAPELGVNRLADETYAQLLHRLARQDAPAASADLRRALVGYFSESPQAHLAFTAKQARKVARDLPLLEARGKTDVPSNSTGNSDPPGTELHRDSRDDAAGPRIDH